MKKNFNVFKILLSVFVGMCLGGYWAAHKYCRELSRCRMEVEKKQYWVRMYDMWMRAKQSSKSIEKYLEEKGIRNIAIYGASFLGIRLYYELRESCIDVKYMLDKNPGISVVGIDIRNPDDCQYEAVDAVIVSALFTYDDIEKMLVSKGYARVIALNDIIYDMIM